MTDQRQSDDVIIMTHAQLEMLKATVRTEAKVTSIQNQLNDHVGTDAKTFEAMFKELRKIDSDVNAFPQRVAECQKELRNEISEKYISKKEIKAGFAVLAALQIAVGLLLALNNSPTHEARIVADMPTFKQELKQEIIKDLRKGH